MQCGIFALGFISRVPLSNQLRIIKVIAVSVFYAGRHIKTPRLRIFNHFPLTWQRFVIWSRHYFAIDRSQAKRNKETGRWSGNTQASFPMIFQWFDDYDTNRIVIWLPHRFVKFVSACKKIKRISSINFYRTVNALLPSGIIDDVGRMEEEIVL